MPVSRTEGRDEEFQIPATAQSPITGVTAAANWGALNKFNSASRQQIGDAEADELINFLPQLQALQQVPGPSSAFSTLPSPVIWDYCEILNGNLLSFHLCTNGTIYQVNEAGTQTIVGTGFSTGTNQVDIAMWQGTQTLISDVVQQKIFSWNGSILTTLLSSQPASFIEVYSGRLWGANGPTVWWTNAGTNNSLSGDAGAYSIADGQCANPVIALQDFGGSLYVFGSNWIKTINSLNDVGSPAVLTFQQPLLTAQVSIINKWSIMPYGTELFFANAYGIWRLEGAVPVKISAALDGFFVNLQTANCSWTAAYGQVLAMPCLFWQACWAGDGANTIFGYTANQQWFRVIPNAPTGGTGTGSAARIFGCVSSAITNNLPVVHYTDGTNLYTLFGAPSAPVTSTFNSKLWSFYSILAFDMFTEFGVQFVINTSTTLTIQELDSNSTLSGPNGAFGISAPTSQSYSYNPNVGAWVNNAQVNGLWINAANVSGNWSGSAKQQYVLEQAVIPFQERNMGVNLTFVSAGLVLQAMVVGYRKMLASKG
jgi:hypothetical protein